MSLIRDVGSKPETIDTRPMCECDETKRKIWGLPCNQHPGTERSADAGRFRDRYMGRKVWFCSDCLRGHEHAWERIS